MLEARLRLGVSISDGFSESRFLLDSDEVEALIDLWILRADEVKLVIVSFFFVAVEDSLSVSGSDLHFSS